MGSQVSVKTNDKEQQLKKASKMSLIRSLLPIVGLVVIFLLLVCRSYIYGVSRLNLTTV